MTNLRSGFLVAVLLATACCSLLTVHAQDTPLTNKFPTAPNSADSLGRTANNPQGTLADAIDSSQSSFSINGIPSGFPSSGLSLLIDSEIVLCTTRSSGTFSGCLRGQKGTTAASHTSGTQVRAPILSETRDVLRDTIISHETKIGAGVSTPAANKVLTGTGPGTSGWLAQPAIDCTNCTNVPLPPLGTIASQNANNVNITGGTISIPNYKVSGTQVVGAQCGEVVDASGSGDAYAQLNALLACLRTHGLIAPSLSYTPLIYASFDNSTDSDTVLPATDIGSLTWTQISGTWGVRQYTAFQSTAAGAGGAVLDAGVSDCNIHVKLEKLPTGGLTGGIDFRVVDANNRFLVRAFDTNIQILKIVGGSITVEISAGVGATSGDWLTVELSGTSIVVKKNGVAVIGPGTGAGAYTSSFNQTSTLFGLHTDDSKVKLKHFILETRTPQTASIRITSPRNRVFQRDGTNHADVPITGAYTGTVTGVQVRYKGGAWTACGTPSGGSFSCTLSGQTTGRGNIEVRASNNTSVYNISYNVGVGDLFLVAGQSNAEGRFTNRHNPAWGSILGGALFDEDLAWRELSDPTDRDTVATIGHPDLGSAWVEVAKRLETATDVPVGIIATGWGGTGLYSPADWSSGGASYTNAVSVVTSAGANGANGLKAVLFYQGETDANNGVTQAHYETALKNMRSSFATDFSTAALKLVVAQIAFFDDSGETRSSVDAVRIGQSDAADTDSNILMGPVLYDTPDVNPSNGGDGNHIKTDAEAEKEIARWVRMLLFHFYGGTDGRGPRFASLTRVDSTHIDVTFTLSSGRALQSSGIPTTGWRVTDSGGSTVATVTAATRQSSSTIRLTVSGLSVTSGDTKVSWASYNDAGVASVSLADDGSTPAPAEPFVVKVVP